MTRQLYQSGGVSSLEQARDVLQAQALPGEFLAYINPQEAAMLKYMGGAGEPINQSGIPSFFVKKFFKSAKKAVSGAVDAVTDFAKSDIGQIALAIAAPYALGAYVPGFATLGGSGFAGAALRSGITSLATQGLTTGRFDLGQAAKAGVIGGAINTGLRNYQQTGNAFTSPVTEGGNVLQSTVVPDAVSEVPADIPTDTGTGRFADFDMRVGAGDEQVFGITPQATTPTVPTTQGIPAISDVEAQFARDFPKLEYAEQFTTPQPTPVKGVTDVFRDQSLTLPQKISEGAKNLVGLGGGDETLKTLIDQPSLSNLMSFAKNNPELLITSSSLFSALSVPKEPDESDFDYEERMKLVNNFASSYGQKAGVDMSGAGDIEDYASYYSQRAGVAMGGSPEVPTGEVRTNPQGIMELDYRDTGGRVPIGVKEKADDVPAMLSKDEFVFTSKAVKNAGNGDVDKGAEKLYKVMNILENGGTV